MKKLSFFNKLLFLFNSISLLLLLSSYLAPYINPNIFWPMAFLGLIFPVLFLLNFMFLIYWMIGIRRQIWANIIILFFGIEYIDSYIDFPIKLLLG